jgi:Pyruvate/2-oxoacid:ferredoxin oxidoreductase gamma subunit
VKCGGSAKGGIAGNELRGVRGMEVEGTGEVTVTGNRITVRELGIGFREQARGAVQGNTITGEEGSEAQGINAGGVSEVEVTRPLLRAGGVLIPPDRVDEKTLPNRRSLNVALLGALSTHLEFPEALWLEAVRAALPERLHDVNEKAFRIGRQKA